MQAPTQKPKAPVKPTLKRIARHKLPTAVLGMDSSADGTTLFAAAMDGVYTLDSESGKHVKIGQHESYVSGAALVQGERVLVTAGYDGALMWHDLKTRKTIRTARAHEFWSWQMALSPDRSLVASATGQYLAGTYKYEPAPEREPSVKIFRVADGKLLHHFEHVPSVQSVAFSPDGQHVAAGNLMGEVRVWNLKDNRQVARWTTPGFTSWGIIKNHCYLGGIFAMQFAPDGESLLLAGMGPMRDPMAGNGRQLWQRFAWRESPARMIDETHQGESGEGLMETLAIHPSGGYFVMAGRLRGGSWNTALFEMATGKRLHSLKTGTRVTKAVFRADGKRLFLAGALRQPKPKDGKFGPFGRVDVYEVS